MARTPVTTEVEQSKREPVPGTINVAEILKQSGIVAQSEDNLRQALAVVEQHKPIFLINSIVDGYRECARPGCGAAFKPKSLNAKDEDVTEYYCSSDCAIHEFYRKRGLGPVPTKVISGAESSARHAMKTERQRVRVEKSAEAETKHGPLRAIAEVLSTKKGSKRVKYECGHEGSVGARANRGRCRKCRVGSENRVEAEEKPKRTPIQIMESAKKHPEFKREKIRLAKVADKKRTPVKPPKRGKKGKR
jgi:hypothetical protein